MQKLITLALYNAKRFYCLGALNVVRMAPEIYPGWQVRVYHDQTVPSVVVERLRASGAQTEDMSDLRFEGSTRMLWRYIPLTEGRETWFISRDCDSRISKREAAAVEEWVQSGMAGHCIRDSDSHGTVQFMGGLCGFRGIWPGALRSIVPYAMHKIDPAGCGVDQAWLAYELWPIVQDSTMYHGCYGGRPLTIPIDVYHCGAPWGVPREEAQLYGWDDLWEQLED